jgi:hypothetical protein
VLTMIVPIGSKEIKGLVRRRFNGRL